MILIERLKGDELHKLKTQEILADTDKRFRTLYFENNVDVRICHKNGNSTLNNVWSQLHFGANEFVNYGFRKSVYEDYLHLDLIEESPQFFRKGSYRIAVKRDPVDRAISAAKQVLSTRLYVDYPTVDMVEEILMNCDPNIDHHFLSQTYWMGNVNEYNKIYDILDLSDLVKWLANDYSYPYEIKYDYFNKSQSKINVNDLSTRVVDHVKNVYEIDYKNGWF